MLESFTRIGGARIGWMNATWPLARLSVSADRLTISVGLLGTYSFSPDQVTTIERYSVLPVIGRGIQIVHCNADAPKRIIFWCFGNPDRLIREIRDAGFRPLGFGHAQYERHGIPFRWPAIILVIAIWNVLLLIDLSSSRGASMQPGPFTSVALAFMFLLALGTLKSREIQRLVLKPRRSVGEVRSLLRLLAFISGVLLIALVLQC